MRKKANVVVGIVAAMSLLLACARGADAPLKLAKTIQEASAVILCDSREANGTMREVVVAILLRRPGIEVPYAVGAEIVELRSAVLPNRRYGEQDIIFMRGNPARPERWVTVHSNKVAIVDEASYWHVSLHEVKQMLSAANQAAQATAPKVADPGR
jgi:hypothetical protein